MASGFQSKQSEPSTFEDDNLDVYPENTDAVESNDELTAEFPSGRSVSVSDVTQSANFSTLSLVETIENNLRRRLSVGLIEESNELEMGSTASKNDVPSKVAKDQQQCPSDEEQRPQSVEVCCDPALEEAEGISHAQLVTKINSTFDDGFDGEKGDGLSASISFASILDEFKPSTSRGMQGKSPKSSARRNSSKASNSARLNLTLTGMKAKQIDRFSQPVTTPRAPSCRSQRQRNPNVMKSMEERLSSAQKSMMKKRPEWNQNSSGVQDKSSKSGKVRKAPRRVNILAAIKPSNVEAEKHKFFASDFSINPVFTYRYPANEAALTRYNNATSLYLDEATAILQRVLKRYGNYEKFEAATGGRVLSRTEIWNTVKRYLDREGFLGEVVVDISNDLLSRAAMTINGGRPTLSIRESSAREFWVEGLLRHEIGTHHLRFHNNRKQTWQNLNVRRQLELQPANPTEEGLASLHSVLMRKDPSLWRAAMLYYTAYKASKLSFVELFKDLGQYIESPDVRWDYCLRTKRGQVDTSKPGCFCKDQVYLTGILALLQRRKTLDFHMLCILGKVSYVDIDRLRDKCNTEGTKIPSFMKDIDEYRRRLDYIVHMNGLERFLDLRASDKQGDEQEGRTKSIV